MNLSDTARERLMDIQELEPTSNSELRDRWGMDSGKDVAAYLREELSEYTYRDDNSKIRAVDRADDVIDAAGESTATAEDGTADSSESISTPVDTEQHGASEHETAGEGDTSAETDDLAETASSGASEPHSTDVSDKPAVAFEDREEFNQLLERVASEAVDAESETGYRTAEPRAETHRHSQTGTSTESCSDCGGELGTVQSAMRACRHAYEETSPIRILTRRRVKKLAKRIHKSNADYICTKCYGLYADS